MAKLIRRVPRKKKSPNCAAGRRRGGRVYGNRQWGEGEETRDNALGKSGQLNDRHKLEESVRKSAQGEHETSRRGWPWSGVGGKRKGLKGNTEEPSEGTTGQVRGSGRKGAIGPDAGWDAKMNLKGTPGGMGPCERDGEQKRWRTESEEGNVGKNGGPKVKQKKKGKQTGGEESRKGGGVWET